MKKERTLQQEYIECDGCKYIMANDDPMIVITVPFDYPWEFMRDNRQLEFHFHAIRARHDCFRYWAHNARVMQDSLKARELDNEETDEFMELMLYRQNSYSPGIEREKKAS